ncbi:MAG: helix-turn-helix domain-containing protein [Myxococcota bacterium]
MSDGALELLRSYDYPGNVRELRNLVERLVILTPGDEITEADARTLLPIGETTSAGGARYQPGVPLREMMEQAERELIEQALEHHEGHMTQTAADLGLERSHLYKKLKSLGIRRQS